MFALFGAILIVLPNPSASPLPFPWSAMTITQVNSQSPPRPACEPKVAVLLVGYGEVEHLRELASYNAQAVGLLLSKFVAIPRWLHPWFGQLIAVINQREYRDHRFISPHNEIFERQRRGIERHLQQRWGQRVQVFKAFNSCDSWFPHQVLETIQAEGFQRVLVYPLLVINSVFTSGLAIEQINQGLHPLQSEFSLRFIPSFHDQPGYIDLQARMIREQIEAKLAAAYLPIQIGIVLVNQGSPEEANGFETGLRESRILAARVKQRLINEYPLISVGWYNHTVPFTRWPGPSVAKAAQNLIRLGAGAIAFVPIGSATENRETILDLDYIIHRLEDRYPQTAYLQLNCVNDHPDFLKLAADWAMPEVEALVASDH